MTSDPQPPQPEQQPQQSGKGHRPAGVVIPVLTGPDVHPHDALLYAATLAGHATGDAGASDHGLVLVSAVTRVGEMGGGATGRPAEALYHLSFEPRRRDGMPPGEAADALRAFLEGRIRQDEAKTGIRLARPAADGE